MATSIRPVAAFVTGTRAPSDKDVLGEVMLFAKKAFGKAVGLSRRRPVTASAILGTAQVWSTFASGRSSPPPSN